MKNKVTLKELLGTHIIIAILVASYYLMMELITKIKEYRESVGMKQAELAELVNVRRETIVCLENGRYNPSLRLAMDIAKVFNVSVEELFIFVDK